jgi:bifunctional UDP-N-acetylglucosamine pyrophosphorylase / glucosamine-1-phosphate N-acetyltransferase
MKLQSIILAAGEGTRMKSNLPKVLHPLAGKALIRYSLDIVKGIGSQKPILVIGRDAEAVEKTIKGEAEFVIQLKRLGTADAVRSARKKAEGSSDLVLIIYGDMPLLRKQSLEQLVEKQKSNSGPLTIATMHLEDSHGFGRIVRENGEIKEIVEEAQATSEQKEIKELNVGAYCVSSRWLWKALEKIPVSPKGEYYLTDLVSLASGERTHVEAIQIEDPEEAIGINNRVHLAEAEAILRKRINNNWMLAGVTIVDPTRTYIEADVQIGRDTVILPNTHLRGKTVIGENCEIGPDSIITSTQIGDSCKVLASVLDYAVLEDHVSMGPYCHLRKGAHLSKGVHMGNFGEVKESILGEGTKVGHFSYIGNATIGKNVNIGAGTITCNFDGKAKHPTEIGDDVFIGSDTMLVAPVKIGKRARTGAGSVVTKDVPEDTVVVGVPARHLRKVKKEETESQEK